MRKKARRSSSSSTNAASKLSLKKETVRTLSSEELGDVAAGITCPWNSSQTTTETQQTKTPTDGNANER